MRPIRVRILGNSVKKIITDRVTDSPISLGVSSERYIDYTNFQEGFVMVYDEELNRYYFANPDDVLDNTYKQDQKPDSFTTILFDDIEDSIDIDLGEY